MPYSLGKTNLGNNAFEGTDVLSIPLIYILDLVHAEMCKMFKAVKFIKEVRKYLNALKNQEIQFVSVKWYVI